MQEIKFTVTEERNQKIFTFNKLTEGNNYLFIIFTTHR